MTIFLSGEKMYKVLLVDDNEQNLYFLQALLKAFDNETIKATNGIEALELARKEPPNIIISDILMPGMDGFALCREWKKDERLKKIPFVFYTATYTEPKDEEFALSLGAERFLVKPKEPDVFWSIIQEVLTQHKSKSLVAVKEPIDQETVYYKEYNETLIRKLEDKMLQLEKTKKTLEEDVLRRKKVERELRKSEEKYRNLIEHASDGIFVTKPDGSFLNGNSSGCTMLGYSREEISHLNLQDVMVKNSHSNPLSRFAELQPEETVLIEQELQRKDGAKFIGEISAKKLSALEILAIIRDISERKELEEKLRQSQKMESVGRLAGGIAHDFNNLLTVILGYSNFILTDTKEDIPFKEDIIEIQRAGQRAADLTRQLLAFGRKQILDMKTVNLNIIIKNMENMLRRLIGENIQFTILPAKDLGNIKADSVQVEQILLNLAANAKDAMKDGGALTIETKNIGLDEKYIENRLEINPGNYVLLTISDAGSGMTKDIVNKIFEPYFSTKGLGKGTGLGLATVYGIVKQSNGYIWVYSEPNIGTTFKIYFPRIDDEPAVNKIQEERTNSFNGTENILIIEDSEGVRKMTCTALKRRGYQIYEAKDGEEALQKITNFEGTMDLLITDVVLPKMNGKELADKIKKLKPDIKIIFMSGYTDETIVHQGILEAGIEFIQKPFSPNKFAEKVRQILDLD